MQWAKRKQGFTIVELLIVVVVIAILAAITIVAYNGIQQNARVSAVKSNLTQGVKALESYKVTSGTERYPFNIAHATSSGTDELQYTYYAGTNTYCMRSVSGAVSYYVTSTNTAPREGTCTITNYSPNPQLGVNTSGYNNQTPTGGTFARQAGAGPNGEAVFDVTTTTNGQLRINMAVSSLAIQQGDQYNASFLLYSSIPIATAYIECFFNPGWISFPIDSVVTGWQRYSAVITAPAGATVLSSCQLLSASSPGVPSGANFKLTRSQLTAGPTLYDYVDGTSPGWSWVGTAHSAISTGPAP